MAKKISRVVKIQARAGEANPASVGKDLGPLGVNLMEFCKRYNAATQDLRGFDVTAVLTVFDDRSFEMVTKKPTTASLLRHAAGLAAGSPRPGHAPAGTITREQLQEVVRVKMSDLNTDDPAEAEKIIAGTARSMGLVVKG
ncbi:50S ribosomal protein L11 [Spongiactinospora sp. 9N601]|uniref:50S ribosomal protein L11 n=1 Tax=Spongiactinospora sp. 9N601 TaxID=3375149 RepID=UPI0037AF372E